MTQYFFSDFVNLLLANARGRLCVILNLWQNCSKRTALTEKILASVSKMKLLFRSGLELTDKVDNSFQKKSNASWYGLFQENFAFDC